MDASLVPGRAAASAQMDRFVHDRLPPRSLWPRLDTGVPPLSEYPATLNAGAELLDAMVATGHADRVCLIAPGGTWTYGDLLARANRIARVLTEDLGVVPGNRVLLRGPNNPMLVACWFAVLKAGAIAVTTMPLLRARELVAICDKAQISHALCDARLAEELELARGAAASLRHVLHYTPLGTGSAGLDRAMAPRSADFSNIPTAADDVALIAFTSGTTGVPKGTVHFHRDVLAVCDGFPKHVLKVQPDDRFAGSAPLAFTFGLGALVLFPMRHGASAVLSETFSPQLLLEIVERHRVTGLYTVPTAYRAMAERARNHDLSSLRACISSGEHLPLATWQAWRAATGIGILNAIGATEMLHIFIASPADAIRPGSIGTVIPGYEARIVDDTGAPLPPGTPGWLAVRGPTGCRYLDDPERQKTYVRDGWNITGDICRCDADGYFWYQSRGDDLIVSAGYNIAGPEVEEALLEHPKVRECAVIGLPDPERGQVVTAFVVLHEPGEAGPAAARELQDFVKARIAPYKYPRRITFLDSLPRTATGKLQRYRLRDIST